jgi:hypothetical protein
MVGEWRQKGLQTVVIGLGAPIIGRLLHAVGA